MSDDHDKCKKRIKRLRNPINLILVKFESGDFNTWFNYGFLNPGGHTNNVSATVALAAAPLDKILRKRKLVIMMHKGRHPMLPCMYLGDRSSDVQTVVQEGEVVAEGSGKTLWPLFEAYVRML